MSKIIPWDRNIGIKVIQCVIPDYTLFLYHMPSRSDERFLTNVHPSIYQSFRIYIFYVLLCIYVCRIYQYKTVNLLSLLRYISAVQNTRYMGKKLADFIQFLDSVGVPASSIHVVGFSLGAEAAGFTGKNLRSRGLLLGRITGELMELFTKENVCKVPIAETQDQTGIKNYKIEVLEG